MSLALPPTTGTNVIGKVGRSVDPRPPFRGRLRLLFAMSFLALPLVGGIWAFAGFAGRSGEQRAESQFAGELRAAVQSYEDALDSAGARANSVAARRDVQLALLRNDRTQLGRIAVGLP